MKKNMLMKMSTTTTRMNKSDLKLIAVLERTGGFASAQELHQILRREGDGIGLTTVYRALQSLVDDKIVDLLRREDGEAIYRLCGDNHHGQRQWLKNLVSAKLGIQRRSSESAPSVNKWATLEAFQPVHVLHVAHAFWKSLHHLVPTPMRLKCTY
jgi:DNA-binding transcriptional ArsR family regulator